jgi:hypothetical protein
MANQEPRPPRAAVDEEEKPTAPADPLLPFAKSGSRWSRWRDVFPKVFPLDSVFVDHLDDLRVIQRDNERPLRAISSSNVRRLTKNVSTRVLYSDRPMAWRASASVEQLRHQTHFPSRHLIGIQNGSTIGVALSAPCPHPRM